MPKESVVGFAPITGSGVIIPVPLTDTLTVVALVLVSEMLPLYPCSAVGLKRTYTVELTLPDAGVKFMLFAKPEPDEDET